MIGIFDYDTLLYKVSFACEKRTVKVINNKSGKEKIFKNQTEFWGSKRNTIEGWLGKQNELLVLNGRNPLSKEDFTLETIRVADPIENALHTTKVVINNILQDLDADEYMGFIGKGDSFRLGVSTLYKYKGTRNPDDKPLLKDEVSRYIEKHHNGIVVEGIEADDAVVMESIKVGVDESCVISNDKDNLGCPVRTYNPDKPELGVIDGRGFGELYIDDKKKVRGKGRIWKYMQVISQDTVDNYKANCFSETPWGEISAYNVLKDCKDDKEAWNVMKNTFDMLYPEKQIITGWRGDEIEIDALYVFQEMMDMVHMQRFSNDRVVVKDVLNKYGVL